MGWWKVSADTLAASRFVISPLAETTASLMTLERGTGSHPGVREWFDRHHPAYRERLVADTAAAIAELDFPEGMAGAEGEHMKAVANGDGVHNLIICTLCSCYPWPVLGLPPYWYKDPTFRSRAAREPRAVLKEFGVDVPADVEIKVWDSSAQIRWFVVPERPEGTDGMTEEQLAALVTPESMMGVALAKAA